MKGRPIEGFGGRTWEELEVIEHAYGQLMFPAVVRRRLPGGEVREIPVRVRVPSPEDMFIARAAARKRAAELEILEDKDRDLFEHLEQLELLALAIRTNDGQHPQFAPSRDLAKYDEGCLRDIQEQITKFKAELDPRERVTTEESFWKLCVDVARSASIDPLGDTDGRDQPTCVVRMALEALRSPTGLSWLQRFGISIPELSALPSSSES